jgi:hypothetical protein
MLIGDDEALQAAVDAARAPVSVSASYVALSSASSTVYLRLLLEAVEEDDGNTGADSNAAPNADPIVDQSVRTAPSHMARTLLVIAHSFPTWWMYWWLRVYWRRPRGPAWLVCVAGRRAVPAAAAGASSAHVNNLFRRRARTRVAPRLGHAGHG